MDSSTPAWLKAAQNGSVAEARTKAFLLDRFWVLERSVDIDGADFIIQRRLTGANLLDRAPPRLGVVQVKFFASVGTTQYIHREYVQDGNGQPRAEFFVMCHSGGEEDAAAYLMTAKEVMENFEIVSDGKVHAGKYRLGGTEILGSKQFAIRSKRLALDRMERSLQAADFASNRSFMSWLLPSARLKHEAIDPIYREPLENSWGDIPTAFLDLKKKAQTALFHLEDVYQKFAEIVESTDPEKVFELLEEIAYECRAGNRWSVSLPDDLDDEDFRIVVAEHRHKVATLKSAGVLDAFIEFNRTVKDEIASYLAPRMPLKRSKVHVVTIRYRTDTLTHVSITSKLGNVESYVAAPTDKDTWHRPHQAVLKATPGFVRFWWQPGIYALDEKSETMSWKEYVENKFWDPYRAIMDTIYDLHFGGET